MASYQVPLKNNDAGLMGKWRHWFDIYFNPWSSGSINHSDWSTLERIDPSRKTTFNILCTFPSVRLLLLHITDYSQ